MLDYFGRQRQEGRKCGCGIHIGFQDVSAAVEVAHRQRQIR